MTEDQTRKKLRHIVNNVIAKELSKNSIYSQEEIHRAADILNGRMHLVEVSMKIAEATHLPLHYWVGLVKLAGTNIKNG